jgi:predicted nucleic acid-binding protein
VIADTSAWVEYLRGTGSPANVELRRRITGHADVMVPELVVMELLVGAGEDGALRDLRRLLHTFEVVPLHPIVDTEQAALLQRQCRRAGHTVRSMVDCMIGAMAVRLGAPVLHADRDFEVLSAHTAVEVVDLD